MKQIYISGIYFHYSIQKQSQKRQEYRNKGVQHNKIARCLIGDQEGEQHYRHIGQKDELIQIQAVAFFLMFKKSGIDDIRGECEEIQRQHNGEDDAEHAKVGRFLHQMGIEVLHNHEGAERNGQQIIQEDYGEHHILQHFAFAQQQGIETL